VFDALTSVRPYKKAWTEEEALAFLVKQKGGISIRRWSTCSSPRCRRSARSASAGRKSLRNSKNAPHA
jgi:hypothetical protein